MESEWTVVDRKRKRSTKKGENNQHPRKKQKVNHTEETEDCLLNVIEPKPEILLKQPVTKKKQKKRTVCPDGIAVRDLQNLILYMYNVGVNQNWIFLKVSERAKKF